MVKIKNISVKPLPSDGERIYVDRLWTDGAFTEFVKISEWNQKIAPSYDLWRFHSDPKNWDHFVELYSEELKQPEQQQELQALHDKAQSTTVTLVYGNGDVLHNCALVLKHILEEKGVKVTTG